MPFARSSRARTLLAAATVTAALGATVGAVAAPASALTAVHDYVALGDSYASGAGVPTQVDTACTRSDHNYPSLLTASLAPAAHADVTCGGATTEDMTTSQSASAPPQFDALGTDTDLVTVTIGGNDIGFADILTRCISLGVLSPSGAPCKTSYTWTGTDQLAATINSTAPKIAAVLDGVHQRAPQAKVLVVGYPDILPEDGSNCPSTVSVAKGDAPWLRDTEKRLNSMIAAQAVAHHAVFVDTYARSVGHDVCKPVGTRWVEPLVTSAAAPFHPNAAGEQSMAAAARGATG